MKRIIAFALCLLLTASLIGCGTQSDAYVPTGNALVIDGYSVPPTEDPNAAEQFLELAYYPNYSLNPYMATNTTNRVSKAVPSHHIPGKLLEGCSPHEGSLLRPTRGLLS